MGLDPVSLGIAFSAISTIGSIATGLSGGAEDAANARKVDRLNQRRIAAQRERDVRLTKRDASALRGEQRSLFSFGNVVTGAGSPLLIERETLREERLDIQDIVRGAGFDASESRIQRRARLSAARQRQVGAVTSGLSSIATTFFTLARA